MEALVVLEVATVPTHSVSFLSFAVGTVRGVGAKGSAAAVVELSVRWPRVGAELEPPWGLRDACILLALSLLGNADGFGRRMGAMCFCHHDLRSTGGRSLVTVEMLPRSFYDCKDYRQSTFSLQ